jgi:hypothetical protein
MSAEVTTQPKPLAEIEVQYPNHWILIDQPLLDEWKRLVAGVVVFTCQEKAELYSRLGELKLARFAIRCTKKDPPYRKYL